MARRAGLIDLYQNSVLVAIIEYILYPLDMAGSFPLLPEFLA